jgi:hypothetical protein
VRKVPRLALLAVEAPNRRPVYTLTVVATDGTGNRGRGVGLGARSRGPSMIAERRRVFAAPSVETRHFAVRPPARFPRV